MIIDGENTELNTVSVYVLEEDEGSQISRPRNPGQYCADISTISDRFKFSDTEGESPSSDNDNEEDGYILEQRLKIIGNCKNVFIFLSFLSRGLVNNPLPAAN